MKEKCTEKQLARVGKINSFQLGLAEFKQAGVSNRDTCLVLIDRVRIK